ncbi:hypothetical protein TNCV_4951561 [Trichonephila clavipes]|nr:hypothetical protein TNCV_4951561 [Trichonephila clavipes]
MANNQSVRRHLDAFTRGRIIGKLEEGRSVTSVAAEFELLTASFHDFGDNFTGTAIQHSGRQMTDFTGQKNRRQTQFQGDWTTDIGTEDCTVGVQ